MSVFHEDIPSGEMRGQFASDAALDPKDPRLLHDPRGVKDVRGDGNSAFHNNGLFDEDPGKGPDELGQLTQAGEGIHVRDINTIRRAGSQALKDQGDTTADEWMKSKGLKW